jgi:hypothetical protein
MGMMTTWEAAVQAEVQAVRLDAVQAAVQVALQGSGTGTLQGWDQLQLQFDCAASPTHSMTEVA